MLLASEIKDKLSHEITDDIVKELESVFMFRPKFSDFKEIVIEFLCGDFVMFNEPMVIGMISSRYELSVYDTKLLYKKLKTYDSLV